VSGTVFLGKQGGKRFQEPFFDRAQEIPYAGRMGRPKRAADGGLVYHVLNRANARMTIFEKPDDYAAFERVLEEAIERTKTRLLAVF
jgi:hypothetical protein